MKQLRTICHQAIIVGATIFSPQLFAEDELEEVTVTGSYIRGTPGDAPSPVQTLTREDIVISGVSDVSEMIRNLEIASGSDTAPQNETRFNGNSGSGLANVNLRGVGPTATLVLMDGKRLPFAGQKLADGDRFVDVNSIPITMVQRVEVLKDGGSAIYGSDAIAGVVNFITRSDFEGFEVTGKFQQTDKGSQDDATLGAIYGWGSEDGKSNFVIGGEYFDRGHLESKDRRDLTNDVFPLQNDTIVNAFAFVTSDPLCAASGFFVGDGFGGEDNTCNRNGSDTELLIPAQERASVMANFTHEFSEKVEFYSQLSWLDSQSGENRPVHVGPIEPKYALPGILNALVPFGIGSNPTNDPSLPANGGTAFIGLDLTDYELRTPGIDADRNFFSRNEQETTRFQVGFRGDFEISDRPWHYDVSVTRGDSEFSTHFLGLDSDRLELAAYGLGGPNCVPDGSLSLSDPRSVAARRLIAGADGIIDTAVATPGSQGPLEGTIASLAGTLPGQPFINPDNVIVALTSSNRGDNSQGCFFFNPYLTRASTPGFMNSEELLRWMEVPIDPAQRSETFITVADFVVSGELMDMKAGPLAMAFGLQRREEGRTTFVNPKTIGEVNSFGVLSNQESVAGLSENRNFDAERDINAVFVEFGVPLTEDIDIQLAGRYEDYGSSIGSTFDPKLGIRWQATDSLALRSSASSSFRGPGLAQIEEGTGFSLEFGVPDVLGPGSDAAGPNCVRTGRCALPAAGAPQIIVKQGLATASLAPEEAITYNIGGIWTPVDGPLEGLTVGLDYYNIEITDKIIDVPTQSLLTEELALFNTALAANDFVIAVPGTPGFGSACDPTDAQFDPGTAVTGETCQVNPNSYAVNPGNSAFAGGNITRRTDGTKELQIISSGALNTGSVETNGIDANFSYMWENDMGAWVVDGRLNYIREFLVSGFPGGQPDFDAAGFTNNDPNRRLTQSMPDLKGNMGLTYLRDRHAARLNMRFVGSYEDNAGPANVIGDGSIDTYYAFDLNYTYAMPLNDSELVFTFGGLDLFDADLPKLKNANGTDLLVFDPRGRRIYGSVKFSL